MSIQDVLVIILSSTVLGTIISSIFTRKSNKESNDIQLLDRAYKEIERLDDIVRTLREQLSDKDYLLSQSESQRRDLVRQLDDALWKLERAHEEIGRIKNEYKKGESS